MTIGFGFTFNWLREWREFFNHWHGVVRQNHSKREILKNYFRLSVGHFQVVLCLFFKARSGAKPFIWKWALFACEWKVIWIWKLEHQDSLWNHKTTWKWPIENPFLACALRTSLRTNQWAPKWNNAPLGGYFHARSHVLLAWLSLRRKTACSLHDYRIFETWILR